MNDKIFKLLNQLKAVQILIECDGNEMSVCYENDEKNKQLQKEVNALSAKEVEILNELRKEVLSEEKPKATKRIYKKKEVTIRSNGNKK